MRAVLWIYSVLATIALVLCAVFDEPKQLLAAIFRPEPITGVSDIKVSGRFIGENELNALMPAQEVSSTRQRGDVFLLARIEPQHINGRPIVAVTGSFSAPPLLKPTGVTLGGFGGYTLRHVQLPAGVSAEQLIARSPHFELRGAMVK